MTAEAKHMAGLWIVEPINDGQSYQITTAESTGFRVIAETDSEANARLFAAAPDLLVAVQRCLNFIEGTEAEFGENFECGDMARAAIAKAIGDADA